MGSGQLNGNVNGNGNGGGGGGGGGDGVTTTSGSSSNSNSSCYNNSWLCKWRWPQQQQQHVAKNNNNSNNNNSLKGGGGASFGGRRLVLSSSGYFFVVWCFVVYVFVGFLYGWLALKKPYTVAAGLSSFGCQEDSEGSWSIGIFFGNSPFSLKPIETVS